MLKNISNAQKGFWYLNKSGKDHSQNIISIHTLKGNLDIDKIKNAIKETIDSHNILNSRFLMYENKLKVKYESLKHEIRVLKKRDFADVRNFIISDSQIEFSLENGPLVQFYLIYLENSHEYILYFKIHHIISDEWSINIILNDISRFYNKDENLPVKTNYFDFLSNQEENRYTEEYKIQLDRLRENTSNSVFFVPRNNNNRSVLDFKIGKNIHDKLLKLSQSNNLSIYMTLILYYSCYKFEVDKSYPKIGIVMANRMNFEYLETVGLFTNIVPFKLCQKSNDIIKDFCEQFIDLFDYQNVIYEDLIEAMKLQREMSHSHLIDTLFIYRETSENLKLDNIVSYEVTMDLKTEIRFNKIYSLIKNGESYKLKVEYNNAFYDKNYVAKETNSLFRFIEEKEELEIKRSNNNFIDLFEDSVEKNSKKTALIEKNGRSISYEDLSINVNKLCNHLKEISAKKNQAIVVKAEKNIETIVAMLAIMKYGSIYVPIDIEQSDRTFKSIINDCKPEVILDTESINLIINNNSYVEYNESIDDEQIAYIIYTSGSTGIPKGVKITHKSFNSYINSINHRLFSKLDTDSATVSSPLSFDASLKQIQLIVKGYTLYLVDRELRQNSPEYLSFINNNKIELIDTTPSELSVLKEYDEFWNKNLKVVLVGGEPIDQKLWSSLINSTKTFYNNYGPTECTINVMCRKIQGDNPKIGKPLDGIECIIVDTNDKEITGYNIPGELLVSGDCVTKGYVNASNNKNTFIYLKKNGVMKKFYKTGDIVLKDEDNEFSFISRKDRQVKIRGYRIELFEIENEIKKLKFVDNVKVLVDGEGINKKIIAYILGDSKYKSDILQNLKKDLEFYKIPNDLVFVNKFQIRSNGKFDENYYKNHHENTNLFKEVKNVVIFDMWCEILNLKNVSTDDNFFEIGGNSLSIIKLLAHLNKQFPEVSITLADLFENQTIKELDDFIEYQKGGIEDQI